MYVEAEMKTKRIGVLLVIGIMLMGTLFVVSEPENRFRIMNAEAFQFRGVMLYVGGTGPNNYTNIQDAVNDIPEEVLETYKQHLENSK